MRIDQPTPLRNQEQVAAMMAQTEALTKTLVGKPAEATANLALRIAGVQNSMHTGSLLDVLA